MSATRATGRDTWCISSRKRMRSCSATGTTSSIKRRPCIDRNGHCYSSIAEETMPEKETVERARKDKRQGKAPTTQAGEFVREEMHHVREGKHGARSPEQAIAIGLSKARRAGVKLPPPKRGQAKERTRKSAESAFRAGQRHPKHKPSRPR